jgi:competence protein ComEC
VVLQGTDGTVSEGGERGTRSLHGSRYTAKEFFAAVEPRIAIVSVGAHNRYGHPSQHVLDALARTGSRVVRTDLHGDVLVAAGRTGLQIVMRGAAQPH